MTVAAAVALATLILAWIVRIDNTRVRNEVVDLMSAKLEACVAKHAADCEARRSRG